MSNAVPDTAYCYLHRRPATREPHSSGEPATRDSAIDVDHSYNMWKKALSHLAHDATTATTGHRWHRHSRQQVDDQEDDQLPSTADLERMEQEHPEEEDNFFAHPFPQEMPMPMPVAAAPAMAPMPRAKFAHISVPEDESSNDTAPPQVEEGEASGDGQEARNHWGKMVDKIKLISNIQTFSGRETVTTSIAPYYSPLFEPAFIAFTKDEYGRRMPPIMPPMISVSVTDSEYISSLSQWVFRVELQYGDIKWVIKRTISDFVTLHYTLKLKSSVSDYVPAPPAFPDALASLFNSAKTNLGLDRLEDEVPEENEDEEDAERKKEAALSRRVALTEYLRDLVDRAHMLVSYDVCEFFELSAVSIVQDMGWKGKEGFLENRVRISNPNMCHLWKTDRWNKEWVLLRDSYVAFCDDIASPTPSDVLLLDNTFTVKLSEPGLFRSHHMTLSTRYREIEIKGSQREVEEWMESIEKVKQDSPWIKKHRFGSFAPIRHNAKVKWFVDGENHFNAVAEAILAAKTEIYITDWWLTPELYLRRPPEKNEEFRIDRLLKRKAEEGVKVYIIVYKEMSLALTIDSAHTKQWLQSQHENIIVQRHPDRRPFDSRDSILFWSHHEKIVVVDNRLAFIGGVDLCFGRYDTHAHRHADYPAKGHQYKIFPGQDYSSPRVKDFADVAAKHDTTLVDREETPRMPWHDLSCAVVGPIARDAARLFIERWNYLKSTKSMHRPAVPFLMPKGEYVAARDESKFQGKCRVQLLRSASSWSSGITREHSIYNAYMEAITQAKHFIYIENQFFISSTGDDKIVHNKIGQAILNRIKRAHYNNEKFKVFIIIPLIPAFEGDLTSGDSMAARGVMHFQYVSISRGGESICEKLREEGIEPSDYIGWYSLRNWDKIVPRFPKKKTNGHVPAENNDQQEDLSTMSDDEKDVHAEPPTEEEHDDRDYYVSELVYIHDKLMIVDDRIVIIGSANINDRSMLGNRDSEVAIFIEDKEMIPSYLNGELYQASKFAHTLRMQLWKEHLGLLDFNDWDALMDGDNHDVLQTCTSEGLGYNSSASGACNDVEGNTAVTEDLDIKNCEAGEAVRILDRVSRTKSIYDRFGHGPRGHHLKEAAALDPLSDRGYYNIWRKTARSNTEIYRDLFRCVPDDTVHTFDEHHAFVSKAPYGHVADPDRSASDIEEKLSVVRGHLVEFPIDYLKDESLMSAVESMAPMVLFT